MIAIVIAFVLAVSFLLVYNACRSYRIQGPISQEVQLIANLLRDSDQWQNFHNFIYHPSGVRVMRNYTYATDLSNHLKMCKNNSEYRLLEAAYQNRNLDATRKTESEELKNLARRILEVEEKRDARLLAVSGLERPEPVLVTSADD